MGLLLNMFLLLCYEQKNSSAALEISPHPLGWITHFIAFMTFTNFFIAVSRRLFPTKHQGQTVSETTSTVITFFAIITAGSVRPNAEGGLQLLPTLLTA